MPALVLFALGLVLQAIFTLAGPHGGPGWHIGFQGDAPVWQQLVRFQPVVAVVGDLREQLARGQEPDWPAAARGLASPGDSLWLDLATKVQPGDLNSQRHLAPKLAAGDARVWRLAVEHGVDDELRLPWRPPGMVWFLSLFWNGDSAQMLPVRILFAALGAAIAPLLWLLVRAHVAATVALAASALCAISANTLLLGSGLHSETLYLVLMLVTLLDQRNLSSGQPWLAALRLGLLHGFLCLLRAEHAVTVGALFAIAWWLGTPWRALLAATLAAAAVLTPWQLHANRLVAAYNAGAPALPNPRLPWDADATARLRTLPRFAQVATHGFVTDTMHARGGTKVTAHDLDVVREAYGCFPEPLRCGFIAIYGPLNFLLANSREADGGFARTALDRAPPLTGGDHRYPPGLRRVLPTGGNLVFGYPPHLDAVVNGTARGLDELRAAPGDAFARIGKKLWHAVEGATPTIGGSSLPIGLSGQRRAVDLVTATGLWPTLWRVALLGLAGCGLWQLRRLRVLWPLFAFALTKVAVVAVYFGYARQGALCLPLLALGIAAALHTMAPRALAFACRPKIAFALLGVLIALDCGFSWQREASLGGQPVVRGEPFGVADFTARPLEFR